MQRLQEFNIRKIGQLASLDRTQLYSVFGRRGDLLYDISRGVDNELVLGRQSQVPSVSAEHVFADDTGEYRELAATAAALAVRIGMKLRTARMVGRRMALTLRYTDGSEIVRQAVLKKGKSDDFTLRNMALLSLKRCLARRVRVRACRLVCDRLGRQSPQLQLFAEPERGSERQRNLCTALDAVRHRFGRTAVRFGSQAGLH
jgi:DNA polymerase-4